MFRSSILERADQIFEARQVPALRAMGADPSGPLHRFHRALLAVALSRIAPTEGRAVLTQALRELESDQERVLAELARRYATEERATLAAWYYGPEAKQRNNEAPFAAAILRGLADAGVSNRAVLASLVRRHPPPPDAPDPVVALMAATKAAGFEMSERCNGWLEVRGLKSGTREQRNQREREMVLVRKACVDEAVRLLRRVR